MFTGPNIVRDGLVLALDAANEDSFRGEPTTNYLTNGAFAGGLDIEEEGGSNPTNTIVQLSNPGDSPYVLQQTMGSAYTEYQVTVTGLSASTTYVMSGWYAESSNYSGQSRMFHSRAYSSGGSHTSLGVGIGTTIETKVINGITWRYVYATLTTPSDATGLFHWYVGYSNTSYTGARYYTNLQIEQGTYPTRFVNGTRGTTVATGGGWKDMSGRGNHGQILNGTSTSNKRTPLEGLDFDGADDRVTVPAFTYTPYCIDFWLYNNSLVPNTNGSIGGPSTYQTLISFGGGTAGVNLGGWTSGATNEALHIWSTSGGNRLTYTRDESIPVGYHNWIFNWNGSQYDIWVDGEKLNTYAGGGGHASLITYTNQPLYLGTDANTYEFYGKIFKFKMYQSQLSDRQVLNNFNAHRSKYGL